MTLPVRKKLRIKNFDYSTEGYYFVTICTKNMDKLFGEITNPLSNTVQYSKYGCIAEKHIRNIATHYHGVRIDKYIIMPNHVHMIIVLGCNGNLFAQQNPSISTIVGLYKSGVSRECGVSVWQRLFHDHVIRSEKAYQAIWNYIDQNPIRWEKDIFYI